MLSDIDKEFVNENYKNMTINEMWKYFNEKYSTKEIRNYCNWHKLAYKKMPSNERKLAIKERHYTHYYATPINYDYFKVWSPNMAYILGLWWADGNIYHNNKNNVWNFSIKLKQDDAYLLQEILNEMESRHKIYKKKDNSCEISICCKEIYNDIKVLGGIEQKSLKLHFPNIPEKFLPHFIRGYFDGDGHMYKSKNAAYFISTKEFCEKLEEILLEKGIICSSIKQKHPERGKDNNCYTLNVFRKDEFIKLAKYLYKDVNSDCIVMTRKDMRKRIEAVSQKEAFLT